MSQTNASTLPLVLLVEDDPGSREVMTLALEAEGFAVVALGSGEEALQSLGTLSPCGLVTDLSLVGMSGTEMTRKLRAQPKHDSLGVIALTGWDPKGLPREDAALFSRVFLKPVDIAQLATAIRALPGC